MARGPEPILLGTDDRSFCKTFWNPWRAVEEMTVTLEDFVESNDEGTLTALTTATDVTAINPELLSNPVLPASIR